MKLEQEYKMVKTIPRLREIATSYVELRKLNNLLNSQHDIKESELDVAIKSTETVVKKLNDFEKNAENFLKKSK